MPRRTAGAALTPLELEIMKVLWGIGPASVQAVQQRLAPHRRLAYNTVQTMLNVLHRKGKVKHTLKDRAYHYAPTLSRLQATRQVETRHLTREKLAVLAAGLEAREGGGRDAD